MFLVVEQRKGTVIDELTVICCRWAVVCRVCRLAQGSLPKVIEGGPFRRLNQVWLGELRQKALLSRAMAEDEGGKAIQGIGSLLTKIATD